MVDNIYDKNTLSNTANGGTSLSNNSQNTSSLSPWDEDLDLPEEAPRGTVVGSLNPTANVAAINSNKVEGPDKFAVPSDQVATNAVPTLVQTNDYLQSTSAMPQYMNQPDQPVVQSNGANVTNIVSAPIPITVPQESQPVVSGLPTTAEMKNNSLVSNNQSINDNVVASPPVSQSAPPDPVVGVSKNSFPKPSFLNKNKPNQQKEESKEEIQVGLETKKTLTLKKGLLFSVFGVGVVGVGFFALAQMGILPVDSILGGLGNDTQTALGKSLLVISKSESIDVKGSIILTVNKDVKSNITTPLISKDNTRKSYTKLYEKAFLASDESTLPSDTLSDSSSNDSSSDSSSDSSYDYLNSSSDGNSSSSDQGSSDTGSSTDQTTSSDTDSVQSVTNTDSESNTLDQSQSDLDSYQSVSSSTSSVDASFDGTIRNNGSDLDFKISRVVGESELSVKQNEGKIWVQSNDIKYSSKETPSNWVQFDLKKISDSNLIGDFFSAENSQGMSVKGKKLGSEVVSGVKSYKYSIDSLEIGDSLQKFGVDSDMIQSITGDVWIRAKDKKLQKINLKINTSPQGPVSDIDLKIEFTGYDQAADFSEPDSSSIILSSDDATATDTSGSVTETPGNNSTSTTNDNESVDSNQSASDNTGLDNSSTTDQNEQGPVATVSNDDSRRNNLKAIKDALEKYKIAQGKYPIAKDLIHLNSSANIVETSLVPGYISVLPKDPDNVSGWFYGYKSVDGKSFYLTSRMEESSADTKLVDGLYLYFLYNN